MNQANSANAYSDFTKIDDRCVGGKTVIMQHMKNHYDKLISPKPQLKIEEPKRYIHDTKKPKHKEVNKRVDPFEEVKVAMRKVATTTKGYTDTQPPVSVKLNMKNNLKGRFEKEKKHEQQEHKLNMDSMNKKLAHTGKAMKDRLKDPNDPVAHPVRLFRRKNDLPNKKIEYVTNLPAGSRLIVTNDDKSFKQRVETKLAKSSAGGLRGKSAVPRNAATADSGRHPQANLFESAAPEEGVNSAPGNKTIKKGRFSLQKVFQRRCCQNTS